MNMCDIKFQVLRLSNFVFNKCSGIIIFTIIFVVNSIIRALRFGWSNVGPASQTVDQHYFTFWPMYLGSGLSDCRG